MGNLQVASHHKRQTIPMLTSCMWPLHVCFSLSDWLIHLFSSYSWAEASKNFEVNKLAEFQGAPTAARGLKHSQLKQMKKEAFLDTIELYKSRAGSARRNFNEFIQVALREMRAFEVADDLEAYKALLSVLPRGGRLKAKSFFHAEFGAYRQQQDTILKLLMQLNANRRCSDNP